MALIEHQTGHAQSAKESVAIVLYLIAFGMTFSLLQFRPLKRRLALAVVLAPVLFVIILFGMGIVAVNLGILSP